MWIGRDGRAIERRAVYSKLTVLFSKGNFCLYTHPCLIMRASQTRGFHADTMNRYILFFGINAGRLSLFKDLLLSVLIETLRDDGGQGPSRCEIIVSIHLCPVSFLRCCKGCLIE